MEIRRITPGFAVSAQIGKEDVAAIAASGFLKVINNRPDGEEAGQPDSMSIMSAVSSEGVEYLHVPIAGGDFGDQKIQEFSTAVQSAKGPVLAFCRTGNRSAKLWALSQAATLPIEEILTRTKSAGYDLSEFRNTLEQRKNLLTEGASHENA